MPGNIMVSDIEPGRHVWVRTTADSPWQAAIAEKNSYKCTNGNIISSSSVDEGNCQPMHASSIDTVEDMSKLADLHEGSLLYNIRQRYMNDNIYTFIGSIVSAVNPYKRLPLYDPEMMEKYKKHSIGELPPHVFAVANEAYTRLFRTNTPQCVLISGESGAGKTENTKVILKYLSNVSGSKGGGKSIETQILNANPILEAFGNAKTVHNNNSSRFGKYISVVFTETGAIESANIDHYLLEKNRVISQNHGERNFHIFYNICKGASDELRATLELDTDTSKYYYLSQSGTDTADGIDDVDDYNTILKSMKTMTFSEEEISSIMKTMAAILHLSNTQFLAAGDSTAIKDETCVLKASELLRVDLLRLKRCLTHRTVKIRGESTSSPLTLQLAEGSRDSIAMALYNQVFTWLVMRLNKVFTQTTSSLNIGVLDIFGFENFAVNSFEQFCINFANEKLQEYFNRHIFALEQTEYEAEGISWQNIDYVDNVECVELIEKKLGIISMLDEESNLAKGTDVSLLDKLHKKYGGGNSAYYVQPRMRVMKFGIKHYAGTVKYEMEGFVFKNRDTFRDDIIEMVKATKSDFVFDIFESVKSAAEMEQSNNAKRRAKKKPTIGLNFKTSLSALMANLNAAHPYFVRCIKPNKTKVPLNFDEQMVTDQLRYSGMLETVRIRRAGYPVRKLFDDFSFRFRILLKGLGEVSTDTKSNCFKVLKAHEPTEQQWQLGHTKVFMKEALEALVEKARAKGLEEALAVIRHHVICYVHRRRFLQLRHAVTVAQRHRRIVLFLRHAAKLRQQEQARLAELRRQEELKKQEELRIERERREAELERMNKAEAEAARAKIEEEMRAKEEKIRQEAEEAERVAQQEILERAQKEESKEAERTAHLMAHQQEADFKRENPELYEALKATEKEDDYMPEQGTDDDPDDEDGTAPVWHGLTAFHEGYVTKQGGSVKSWKRRFMILKDGALSYYRGKHQESVKSGYLTKQGGGTSVLGSKAWKRRFFVLQGAELSYYENDSNGQVALGTINIRGCILEHELKAKKKKKTIRLRKSAHQPSDFTFAIEIEQRTYYLGADSEEVRKEWLQVLFKMKDATDAEIDGMTTSDIDTSSAINTIPVRSIYSVGIVNQQFRPYAFAINCKDRVYTMCGDSKEETQEWIRLLTPVKGRGGAEQADVAEKGWLWKDPPKRKHNTSTSSSLMRKKRWFVLQGDQLMYYKSPNDTVPLNVVTLNSLCTVYTVEQGMSKTDHHPVIINILGRTYNTYAPSFADAQRWVEVISDTVDALPPVLSQYERIINEVLKINVTDSKLDFFLDSRAILHYTTNQLAGTLLPQPYGHEYTRNKRSRDYGTLSEEALAFFDVIIDPEYFDSMLQVARDMVNLCFAIPQLTDEITCQLVKQTSLHPDLTDPEFKRNMQLLLILCHTIKISNRVKRFLRVHMNRIARKHAHSDIAVKYANECMIAMENYRERNCIPCDVELESIAACKPLEVEIDCGIRMVSIKVDPHMVAREVRRAVEKEIGLKPRNTYNLFEHTITEKGLVVDKSMEDDIVVCDRIAKWHQYAKGGVTLVKLGYRFLFRCALYTASAKARYEDVEQDILFEQAFERFQRGMFYANFTSTASMATLRAIYVHGPVTELSKEEEEKILPRALIPADYDQHQTEFYEQWHKNGSMDKSQARDSFLKLYNVWRPSRGTIYTITNCSIADTPRKMWLCVDYNGLSLYGVQSKEPLESYRYQEIMSYGAPVPQVYKLVISGVGDVTFETSQVYYIAQLMTQYISVLLKCHRTSTMRKRTQK